MFSVFVLALFFSFFTQSCSWSEGDKYLFSGYASLSALDAYQTSKIEKAGLSEGNPFWARPGGAPYVKKLIVAKIVGAGLILLILDKYPDDRRELLILMNMIQGGVDVWNEYALRHYGRQDEEEVSDLCYRSLLITVRDRPSPDVFVYPLTLDYRNIDFSQAQGRPVRAETWER